MASTKSATDYPRVSSYTRIWKNFDASQSGAPGTRLQHLITKSLVALHGQLKSISGLQQNIERAVVEAKNAWRSIKNVLSPLIQALSRRSHASLPRPLATSRRLIEDQILAPSPSPSPSPSSLEPALSNLIPVASAHPFKPNRSFNNGLVAGICSAIMVMLILIGLFIYGRKRLSGKVKGTKSEAEKNANIKEYFKTHDLRSPREYRYREVKRMTNSFTEKIGQGGFGSVYKGTLPDGKLVAVKVLDNTKGNGDDFINEVSSISQTSHVNIVTLLGYCYNPKKVLIYEYMANGSLDKLIYNRGSSIPTNGQLGWKMLYDIAVGIAKGLEYLHRGCNTRILHFDIKPHNILLDEKFCAKITDFGLAKLGKTDQSHVSTLLGPRGTPGYIAPEVCSNHFGRVSYKSDVYSYGMMVLEMVGQRRNLNLEVSQTSRIYFPHYAFKRLEAGHDIRLDHEICNEEEEEIATKMILVSLWCIQTKPSDRPSMTAVLEMFERKSESLSLPPNPFVASPTASP